MAKNHTIDRLLADGARRVAGATDTALLDAELMLGHVLGLGRAQLKAHAERVVIAADCERYFASIERRARGQPLAYIVGFRDFWTLRLAVTPAVLVPRPETELLVERALEVGADVRQAVDLGTGSGAIALALASERPHWQISATDASAEALAVARGNAAALNLARVEFLEGDWFTPLVGRRFDLIVSNPPYIAADDAALTHPALLHEPPLALSPGADALACLHIIVRDAPGHLNSGGWLLLEHGAAQAAPVARALVAQGFHHVTSRRDLAGHERITEGQWLES